MSDTWVRAELRHQGASVAVFDDSQGCTLLRRKDLELTLGLSPWRLDGKAPLFAQAGITEGVLCLQDDEGEHRLAAEQLRSAPPAPRVFRHGTVMTCQDDELGVIPEGALVCQGAQLLWVGPESELAGCGVDLSRAEEHNLGGRLLSPGLVDCHAHPVFAGRRADEFARRARGDHYLDIAREGGGIKATVGPTRAASTQEHLALCGQRMRRALSWGTTTMEAKSGYDLSIEGELRLLTIAAVVDALQPVDLMPTLLGAHALPAEYQDDREGYIAAVRDRMIPMAAEQGLAGAVDVYCDQGAFTLEETRDILTQAKAHGLAVKAHIGQFADLGGAQLLSELGALSGDHLEVVSAEGIAAMAAAGVVATMLPGACVQLKMQAPPVPALREAGVVMALASDMNPGTSHSETLPVAMWLASTHFSMTVEEAWLGVTRHAATALGRADIGCLRPGARADFVVWDADVPAEIPYHFGVNLVSSVFKGGREVAT